MGDTVGPWKVDSTLVCEYRSAGCWHIKYILELAVPVQGRPRLELPYFEYLASGEFSFNFPALKGELQKPPGLFVSPLFAGLNYTKA